MSSRSPRYSRPPALLGLLTGAWLTASCAGPPERASWSEPPPAAAPVARCRWFGTPYRVYFAPGSAAVDVAFQPEGFSDHLARVVEDYRHGELERVRAVGYVEYYCPSAPSDPELARQRGVAVIERLVELGVPREATELPPLTQPACCTEADDPCDPASPHRLRVVEINYWHCAR